MNSNMNVRRGDIYYVDLEMGIGSEQNGYRPMLILSNDVGNKFSGTVIAAVITSQTGTKAKLPTHILIRAQQSLLHDSLVLLEQIRTIDKARLRDFIGTLDSEDMDRIDRALEVSVGLKV